MRFLCAALVLSSCAAPTKPLITGATLNPELSGKKRFALRAPYAKATVVVFGASHCYPCLLELPVLKKFEEAHRKRGLSMLLVVLDQEQEGLEQMSWFIRDKLALAFPAIGDPGFAIADRFSVQDLPTLLLLGPDGSVAWRETGYKGSTIETLEKQLSVFLNPASPAQ